MITQESLKELFYYNPEDGNLYNRVTRNSVAVKDQIAGTLTTSTNGSHVRRDRRISIDHKKYLAHRLTYIYHHGSLDNSLQIDHINGNTLDNRINNLRVVTNLVNSRNQSRRTNNSSGVTGVRFEKRKNKYTASIFVDYKRIHLGYFTNFEDAVKVRKEAEKLYGFHENHGREPVQISA